jgi:hypothetical protein
MTRFSITPRSAASWQPARARLPIAWYPATLAKLLVCAALLAGCGREQKDWEAARTAGTIAAFEGFLAEHASSKFADSAELHLETLSWAAVQAGASREDYIAFVKRFPRSSWAAEAANRSQWFDVKKTGTGSISLPGGSRTIRAGPMISIYPRWDSVAVRLDRSTLFAVAENGDTVYLRYLVRLDRTSHKITAGPVSPLAPGEPLFETWIPPESTFANYVHAHGTNNGRVFYQIAFTGDTVPVRLGLIFDHDIAQLTVMHILDNQIVADARR